MFFFFEVCFGACRSLQCAGQCHRGVAKLVSLCLLVHHDRPCRGSAEDGFPAIHTVLVLDSRKRSGEHAAMARVIQKLPFTISGDTSGFADNYRCQATVRGRAALLV